jgi:hypothetical protein
MNVDSNSAEKPCSVKYQLSGEVGLGWVILPPAAVLGGALGGWLYGIVNFLTPLIYVQFMVTFLSACGLGVLLDQLAGVAKCRNPNPVYASALLCGLVLFYVSWASFESMFLGRGAGGMTNVLAIAWAPGTMWTIANKVASSGWFNVFGSQISGLLLWVFWAVEALVLIVCPMVLAGSLFSRRVFCEGCGIWVPYRKGFQRISANRKTEEMACNCDLAQLAEAPLEIGVSRLGEYLRVDHSLCEACQNTGTCSVVKVSVTRDDDGKERLSEENISALMILTPEKAQQLGRLVARIKQRTQEIHAKRKADAQEAIKARKAKAAGKHAKPAS